MSFRRLADKALLIGLGLAAMAAGLVPSRLTAQTPEGWLLSGPAGEDYELRLDDRARSGARSARVSSRGNRRDDDWAVVVQMIDATRYRGARIRLRGQIRSAGVGSAGLWMRVDGILDGKSAQIAVDNTEDRRLTGSSEWTMQEIVLDVPPEGVTILYGAMIVGNGRLWLDELTIDQVSEEVQLTAEPINLIGDDVYRRPSGVLPAPANLDFEAAVGDGG